MAKVVLKSGVGNARYCRTRSTKREAALLEINRLTHDIEVKLIVVGAAGANSM
jgi:hypothetical protein